MINRVFADILRVASILLQEAADSSRVHEMLANLTWMFDLSLFCDFLLFSILST
jgi:hypothetical protein